MPVSLEGKIIKEKALVGDQALLWNYESRIDSSKACVQTGQIGQITRLLDILIVCPIPRPRPAPAVTASRGTRGCLAS